FYASRGIVMLQKRVDEIDHLVGLFEAWKYVGLFRLLMIIVDEVADDLGGLRHQRRVEILIGRILPDRGLIEQQHPVQDPVFAHEILGWRHFFLVLLLHLAAGSGFPGLAGHDGRRTDDQKSRSRRADQSAPGVELGHASLPWRSRIWPPAFPQQIAGRWVPPGTCRSRHGPLR